MVEDFREQIFGIWFLFIKIIEAFRHCLNDWIGHIICELLSISDKDKRRFYEIECSKERWSVRELKPQIESSLFERLLLSKGDVNKEKVLSLALKGN